MTATQWSPKYVVGVAGTLADNVYVLIGTCHAEQLANEPRRSLFIQGDSRRTD
ncbi:hypothetical protein BDZ89DRAFT_1065975 [Hymenopellis radicata]|nr:hypothetical protein BDZ89DRAFT_1065975 [Hymenopellis radicata]